MKAAFCCVYLQGGKKVCGLLTVKSEMAEDVGVVMSWGRQVAREQFPTRTVESIEVVAWFDHPMREGEREELSKLAATLSDPAEEWSLSLSAYGYVCRGKQDWLQEPREGAEAFEWEVFSRTRQLGQARVLRYKKGVHLEAAPEAAKRVAEDSAGFYARFSGEDAGVLTVGHGWKDPYEMMFALLKKMREEA